MDKKTFNEIVTFARTGLNPRKNFVLGNGANKYITIKNIYNNRLIVNESTDLIDDEAVKLIHKRSKIKKGDILFCSIGRIGDMYIIEDEPIGWDINESVFAFTLNEDLIRQKYFYYYFKSRKVVGYLDKYSSGSTFKSIKMEQLKKMVFDLPSLEKQDYIINELDYISSMIEKSNSQLLKIDELIKAKYNETFNEKIGEPTKLGKICDVRDGTHDSPKYFKTGYPLVTSKNIVDGVIDFSNCSLISEEDYNKINERSKVNNGDILMPMIGTVGNPIIVETDKKFAIKNVALIKFDRNTRVLNSFVKALLESDYFNAIVSNKTRGGNQKFIALGEIRELEFHLPPIKLQEQFSDFVSQANKTKERIQETTNRTQLLFDSLMQEYFG